MKEYMIVKVQFNVSSKTCTGKLYTFLAYEEYTPGDVVVVDTQNGFQLATVEGTASKIPDGIPTGGLKEIVCKVDFTAWNKRRERAKRMNELQCMMNNKVRDLQETALFEMLASKDPELKAMLDEYFKTELHLTVKGNWQIFPTYVRGLDFVGYRSFLNFTLLRKSSCKSFKQKMNSIRKKTENGQMMRYSEWCSINSYKGWLKHCDSYRLQAKYIAPVQADADRYYQEVIQRKAA